MKHGLVLSGGAAWGLANIGILKVLEREKFRFDCVAGSSMGAIIAAMYALGIPVSVMEEAATKISLLRVAKLAKHPLQNGLHSGVLRQDLEQILLPIIGGATLGDTKIPFLCVAGKVLKPLAWERIVLPSFADHFTENIVPYIFPPDTNMIQALLASSAIPVIFAPVRIGDDEFVDLVHFGSIPARHLRTQYHPDVVIGTDTNPRFGLLQRLLPAPWREFIARGHRELEADTKACDMVLRPPMPAAIFRFDRAKDFIASGQATAEKHVPELRRLLGGARGSTCDGVS